LFLSPVIVKDEKTFDKIVIKQEVIFDDEYEFEFKLSDAEYFKIVQELRAKDDDLIALDENGDEEGTFPCPVTGK
jgi:hypothetical protein